jgi:hypothetical protein
MIEVGETFTLAAADNEKMFSWGKAKIKSLLQLR